MVVDRRSARPRWSRVAWLFAGLVALSVVCLATRRMRRPMSFAQAALESAKGFGLTIPKDCRPFHASRAPSGRGLAGEETRKTCLIFDATAAQVVQLVRQFDVRPQIAQRPDEPVDPDLASVYSMFHLTPDAKLPLADEVVLWGARERRRRLTYLMVAPAPDRGFRVCVLLIRLYADHLARSRETTGIIFQPGACTDPDSADELRRAFASVAPAER